MQVSLGLSWGCPGTTQYTYFPRPRGWRAHKPITSNRLISTGATGQHNLKLKQQSWPWDDGQSMSIHTFVLHHAIDEVIVQLQSPVLNFASRWEASGRESFSPFYFFCPFGSPAHHS